MAGSEFDLQNQALLRHVCILAGYYRHHSAHSGYSRFVDYLPGVSTVRYQASPIVTPRGGLSRTVLSLARQVSSRLLEGASDRSWYPARTLVNEFRLYRMMVRSRERVFHLSYGENELGLLGRVRRPRSCRLLATFHLPPCDSRWPFTGGQSLRRLDAAIAIAPNQVELLSDLVGRDKVFLIPHGVDTAYWCPDVVPRSPGERRIVLSVGHYLRDFKAMGTVTSVLKERWRRDLEFVLITGPDGARLAQQYGVHALVNVPEPELREWYRSASMTLLPLANGTYNNAMLESLACGTPVVASAVGAVPQMAAGGRGVTAVPPNDTEAMIDAVSTLLGDPQPERLSEVARKQAEALDWSLLARTFVNLYRQLLE